MYIRPFINLDEQIWSIYNDMPYLTRQLLLHTTASSFACPLPPPLPTENLGMGLFRLIKSWRVEAVVGGVSDVAPPQV